MRAQLASLLQRNRGSNELPKHEPPNMATEVLNYFVRNPHAADSLEGVARCRLMDEVIRRTLDETEAALEWLVARNYLTRSVSPGGTATFSLNPERAEQAWQFLAGSLPRERRSDPR